MEMRKVGGFSVIGIIITVTVLGVAGFAGWQVYSKNNETEPAIQAEAESTEPETQEEYDRTEDGRYFVISEWEIRSMLSNELQDDIIYKLGQATPDPDNNILQAAKVLIKVSLNQGINSDCKESIGKDSYIDSGLQILRTESGKKFDSTRYRWEFKENVLKTENYNFHINYIETPSCADSNQDIVNKLHELQKNLLSFEEY